MSTKRHFIRAASLRQDDRIEYRLGRMLRGEERARGLHTGRVLAVHRSGSLVSCICEGEERSRIMRATDPLRIEREAA